MHLTLLGFLWAVHLPDGVLTTPWLIGGFAVAAILMLIGGWRVRDDEIPKIALLTAAFFVASLVHVPIPAGPRAHLLLNGLLGIVLGPRVALAIPIGLFLQATLFGHGGFSTLGVNACVMTLPALLAWGLFQALQRLPWIRHPFVRLAFVSLSVMMVLFTVVYSVALLATNPIGELASLNTQDADAIVFHPLSAGLILIASLAVGWWESRLENRPEFALGLLIGELAVLATILLNSLALLYGGEADWHTLALVTVVVHLPIAVIEGIILGFIVGFLARVKPDLLGWKLEKQPCQPGTGV